MKITESTVKQLTITGLERLDPIRVMMEDFGQGRGMITITCFGEAWSNYWGAMGEGAFGEYVTIQDFFATCSIDYLAGKLKNGIEETVCDETALEEGCKKEVIKLRRENEFSKTEARSRWIEIEDTCFDEHLSVNADLFQSIYGDDWWCYLPNRPNPDYVRLRNIVKVVKAACHKRMTDEQTKEESNKLEV